MCAAKIQNDLRILTERLARINDNLARKISSRNEYDKTIQETEAAYSKVSPIGSVAELWIVRHVAHLITFFA